MSSPGCLAYRIYLNVSRHAKYYSTNSSTTPPPPPPQYPAMTSSFKSPTLIGQIVLVSNTCRGLSTSGYGLLPRLVLPSVNTSRMLALSDLSPPLCVNRLLEAISSALSVRVQPPVNLGTSQVIRLHCLYNIYIWLDFPKGYPPPKKNIQSQALIKLVKV